MSVYLSSKYSKCLDFRPYRDRDKSGQSSKVSFESSETKNYLAVWPCLVIVWLKLVDKILYGSGLALIFALLWKSHGKARVVVSLRLAMAVGSKTPLDFCIAVIKIIMAKHGLGHARFRTTIGKQSRSLAKKAK